MAITQQSEGTQRTLRGPTRLPVRFLGSLHQSLKPSNRAPEADAASGLQTEVDEYLSDMVAPHGVAYRGTPASAPQRTAFNQLAHQLLAEALADGQRVDRAVLAHALPDSQPGYSVCASLVNTSPGLATAFAVSEQRVAAPFTALHIAAEYLRGDPDGRVLVMALDQGTVPWDVPSGTAVPGRDVGVGLLLGGSRTEGELLYWRSTEVDAAGAAGAVADVQDDVRRAFVGPVRFVLGGHVPWLRAAEPHTEVRRGPADLVCTSVWTGLWDLDGSSPGGAAVAVAVEYDPALGYFCAVAIPLENR